MSRHAMKIAESTAMESNQNDKNLMRLALEMQQCLFLFGVSFIQRCDQVLTAFIKLADLIMMTTCYMIVTEILRYRERSKEVVSSSFNILFASQHSKACNYTCNHFICGTHKNFKNIYC